MDNVQQSKSLNHWPSGRLDEHRRTEGGIMRSLSPRTHFGNAARAYWAASKHQGYIKLFWCFKERKSFIRQHQRIQLKNPPLVCWQERWGPWSPRTPFLTQNQLESAPHAQIPRTWHVKFVVDWMWQCWWSFSPSARCFASASTWIPRV